MVQLDFPREVESGTGSTDFVASFFCCWQQFVTFGFSWALVIIIFVVIYFAISSPVIDAFVLRSSRDCSYSI